MNTKIKFGTDGFRGIIGQDFTEDTVEKITLALAQYMKRGTVIIGYDPRKDADKFAAFSAEILREYGFDVLLSEKVVPTPVIAYTALITPKCAGALMFTASHNPKEYLGIKFIPNYGGPATSAITAEIEEIIENNTFELEHAEGSILKKDFSLPYFQHLEKIIDFRAIRAAETNIIFDPVHSAASGYFDRILKINNIKYEIYNDNYDPDFGGFLPEPKKENLHHLKKEYITLTNDGDGDRFGVVDEKGIWVSPNIILAILLKYLKEKGEDGIFVKTVGVSQLTKIVAEKLNVQVVETAVGFKWIGEVMRSHKTILAGEDSGGLSCGFHISEKDGIFANLLILEAIAKTGKPLYALRQEIINFAGADFVQDRVDIRLSDDFKKDEIIEKIKTYQDFCNQKIIGKTQVDGIKLYLEDKKSTILIRKSGTEPLLRFYIETNLRTKLASIKSFIEGFMFVLK